MNLDVDLHLRDKSSYIVEGENAVSESTSEAEAPDNGDLLRLIFESVTDFALFALDQSGKVISWNIGAERLTGYSEEEILRRDADVIFTPEDRAASAPEQERTKAALTGRSEDERWHQRKDGTRFWGSGLMMRLRNGKGFVKIMRDRTAPHMKGVELAESETLPNAGHFHTPAGVSIAWRWCANLGQPSMGDLCRAI